MAMRIEQVDLGELQLDSFKQIQFKEYLRYMVSNKKILRYEDFNRMCGLSHGQLEVFRSLHRDTKEFRWSR